MRTAMDQTSEGSRLQRVEIALTPVERPLPEQLARLLARFAGDQREERLGLPQLSLELGRRLTEQAQTITFWQRGELGRMLRRSGFAVRVEYGTVIFIRRSPSCTNNSDS